MRDRLEPGRSTPAPAAPERQGFSLVEVVLALGLLATVLISIASLFILGGKQVHSGKTTTTAVALGHEILERIDQLAYSEIYTYFGGTDTSASLQVSTATTGNNANQWHAEITQKLGPNAAGTITVTPLGSALPLQMGNAQALQVNVAISWNDLGRTRNVSIQTIRY